jgi:hypothetical protein
MFTIYHCIRMWFLMTLEQYESDNCLLEKASQDSALVASCPLTVGRTLQILGMELDMLTINR